MAVKDGILAILSLGPGYGLALRDELVRRAPHRADLNVGQIYSTLDRLGRSGLIVGGTVTDDNLPLYSITPEGLEAVESWLYTPVPADARSWADLLDQILIGSSLPGTDWNALLHRHESAWGARLAVPDVDEAPLRGRLVTAAERQWARAALSWLGETRHLFTNTDPALSLRSIRPQRGRRPSAVATGP